MAHFLESRLRSITDLRHTLLPAVAPTAVFCVLIVAQPDLGTAMTCAFITAAILFISGMEWKYFGWATLGSRYRRMYFLLFRTAWRARRMVAFINPYADPQGAGFHIIQSLIAVGTGGAMGLGLMEGKQKLFYLPEPQTDFIFAVVSEELGLIGAVCFVAAFAFFCFRGLRAAWNTRRQFRAPACRRHHGHDRHSGLLQHQRGAWDCCPPRESRCRSSPMAARRSSSPWPALECCSTSRSRRIEMKIILAGGGTGGHVIPALAIAEELRRRGHQAAFVGTARGIETRLVPKAGFPLYLVKVGALNRVSLATRLRTLIDLPLSIFAAMGILRRFHAQAVIGVGGYAAGPATIAAVLLRIPVVLFEPNVVPGYANRARGPLRRKRRGSLRADRTLVSQL